MKKGKSYFQLKISFRQNRQPCKIFQELFLLSLALMDCPEHQKVKKDKLLLKGGEQITDIYLTKLLVNQTKSGKFKTFKTYQKVTILTTTSIYAHTCLT